MRLHYYRFPEGIDHHTKYLNGAERLTGECFKGRDSCKDCDFCAAGWQECEYFRCTYAANVVYCGTVTAAKQLLKKFGGSAWTEHCERNGTVFEVTPIELGKNNSRFKYNHHL